MTDEEAGGVVSWSEAALGNGGEPPLSDARVAGVAAAAVGMDALQLDVVFVSAAELAEMHGTYLADPTETDVITFDLRDTDLVEAAGPDGELYVSLERARTEATLRGAAGARAPALRGPRRPAPLRPRRPRRVGRSSMRAAEGRVMERLGFAPDRGPRGHLGPSRVERGPTNLSPRASRRSRGRFGGSFLVYRGRCGASEPPKPPYTAFRSRLSPVRVSTRARRRARIRS